MKIKDYFQQQKQNYIPEQTKLDIYENVIQNQNNKKVFRIKSFLHVKAVVYSLVIFLLLFGLYGVYFFNTNDNYQIVFNENGIAIQNQNNHIKSAKADYIAEIINFEGNFFIEHNGEKIQRSNIKKGDIVYLEEGTDMVFNIQTGTQAKISGPAKFEILENQINKESEFRLNLFYGDFVELKSLQKENSQNIIVSTNDLTVKQKNSNVPVNYQIVKKGDQRIVKNNGSDISIEAKLNKNKTIKTDVKSDHLLSMDNNDIDMMSIKDFEKAIKDKTISKKFVINEKNKNTKQTQKDQNTNKETKKYKLTGLNITGILNAKENEEDKKIINNIGNIINEGKKIISPSQNDELRISLNKIFLEDNIKNIYKEYLSGNNSSLNTEFNRLENKIKDLYNAFNIDFVNTKGNINQRTNQLNTKVNNIKTKLDTNYHIPPKYINNLNNISYWLNKLPNSTKIPSEYNFK